MQFETLGKKKKQKILIGGMIALSFVSVISFATTRAKYTSTQNLKLANGTVKVIDKIKPTINNVTSSVTQTTITVNVSASDNRAVTEYWYQIGTNTAVKGSGSSHTFTDLTGETPYTIKVYVKDAEGNISDTTTKTITTGAIPDTEKPKISDVTASVTKTSITVSVSASDNKGVTKYYYQIGTNGIVEQTTSSYTFSGLTAGTPYTVKVYVQDAAGNQSDTTTKTFTTEVDAQTPSSIIAGIESSSSYKGTTTPTFTTVATGAENKANNGIFKTLDPMYGSDKYTYYWRGAATTNHVIFADLCWRIVRINGDNTMRLIYNGAKLSGNKCTGNGVSYGTIVVRNGYNNTLYNQSNYVGWTYTGTSRRTLSGISSTIKTETEKWYKEKITDAGFDGKVALGKFCNDRNVKSGSGWSINGSSFDYAAYTRLYEGTKTPSLECDPGDVYSLKVGAITADEVQFAGASGMTANTSYYLFNGESYWTMTPGSWVKSSGAEVFAVDYSYPRPEGVSNNVSLDYGIRPVINLDSKVTFALGGLGTSAKPYIVQ